MLKTFSSGLILLYCNLLWTSYVSADHLQVCSNSAPETRICANIAVLPSATDPDTYWDVLVEGELPSGGIFAWGLHQDADWAYEDDMVIVNSSAVIAKDGFNWGSSYKATHQAPRSNIETRFLFIFGARSYSHGSYDFAVEVTVAPEQKDHLISIDIKPANCINKVNLDNKGVTPVAIAGKNDFDVRTIDTTTLKLAGVATLRASYEDVTRPFLDESANSESTTCNDDGADGTEDLLLKFSTPELLQALETNHGSRLVSGQMVTLSMSGFLTELAGAEITVFGEDSIEVIRNQKLKKAR